MFYTRDFMFGSTAGGKSMPRPTLFGSEPLSDVESFYFALLLCALSATVVVGISRGRLGRLLSGLGNAPTALETTGAAVNVTRVLVFRISVFLAAIDGAMIPARSRPA